MSKEKRILIGGFLIAFAVLLMGSPPNSVANPQPQTLNLHVPSPDWEDQIIYFIMTDRFNDGDPSNNDQGANEFDPDDGRKYSGGDLQGITDQLDYIDSLGATTVWITPPVANQWWDPMVSYGGYHGYWALDFTAVDAHFGSIETYQALSSGLHDRGMYLIQDIVPNHTGNFYSYEGDYNRDDPTQNFVLNVDSVPSAAPIQPPFDQNNINDPAHREADIYHWTPTITDFNSPLQSHTYQLANLDDINTSNPLVREVLKESYGYWIEEVGVDGFRVDTIIYVEHDFWNDFFESDTGIHATAATTGRDNFFAFGEAFLGSDPYRDDNDMRVASYLGTEEAPELPSVLNFPMHFAINRVFGEGVETAAMTYRIETTQATYPNPNIIPNFIDNHDVARFLSRSNLDGLQQANMFMLTIPGIPIIYYGTEQGFTESRAAMFAEGWESDGVDHFNQESEMFQFMQSLTQLRRDNPIFSRGSIDVLADDADSPGLFIYQREYEGDQAIVVMNTADFPIFVDGAPTGLPAGTVLELMVGLNYSDNIVVGENGELTLELPARAGAVLWVSDTVQTVGASDVEISIDTEIEGQTFAGDMVIAGSVNGDVSEMRLIVNGNARTAVTFSPDADGNWEAAFPITVLQAETDHQLVIYVPEANFVSETYTFQVAAALTGVRGHVDDPAGDARGPTGDYDLPTDETFTNQLDILGVDAEADGPNLAVNVRMTGISDVWGANGFDHVLFHVFIDFPNDAGATVLPMINADAPEGFAWDYLGFIEGWNNRLYSAEGASADNYGTSVTPLAEISVDEATKTITFTFDGAALGSPTTYEGVQIYITTWDWDGPVAQYRGLLPEAGQWNFGGGDGSTDPLILDSSAVFTLESTTPPQPQASAVDEAGDDHGLDGNYSYPTDETFGSQMDILGVEAIADGPNLQVTAIMSEVTDGWGPVNGFDHVMFHVFIDFPNDDGATVLPLLNADAPDGLAWDYMAFIEGWTSRLYSAEGANADNYGSTVTPLPEISTDIDASTITFTFDGTSLGSPTTYEGVQIYVTTWDWDGPVSQYRGLSNAAGQWSFGGGNGATDPLIMDASPVISMESERFTPIPRPDPSASDDEDETGEDIGQAIDLPEDQPPAVSLPGTINTVIGCESDWMADCVAAQMMFDVADYLWEATFDLPAGTYEYKVAINNSWDENYGENAEADGENIILVLEEDTIVSFFYDHNTHWVADSVNSIIANVPGNFQDQVGCATWAPECLRTWLQDPDGDGIYVFSTDQLAPGDYEAKVAVNQDWTVSYGVNAEQDGANYLFTVGDSDNYVEFVFDSETGLLVVHTSGE